MRFLIDEDLPLSTVPLVRRYGHEALDLRDVGLRGATDATIAEYAREHGLCIVTGDRGFGDVRNYPPATYEGIVVLRFPSKAPISFVLRLLEELLVRQDLISRLPGSLAIVEPNRVRIRKA
ncbi:MAG: DUF5615 family PIN-like protein [Chloroflexi bacterium]|nr:DUF5615 family PIN-like protein [Chloroflexota bacterium]